MGSSRLARSAPNNVGVTFDISTEALKTWGGSDDLTNYTRNALGFFQNEQTGVSHRWAVVEERRKASP